MQIIATCNKDLEELGELVDQEEFISENEELKKLLVFHGWAKDYDPSKPRPTKGMWFYEEMEYKPLQFVIKDNTLYYSKAGQKTSTTWIPTEWTQFGQG